MRAIKSSLVIIWLLALIVAAGSALVQRHAKPVNAPRAVYVDREKLIVLHPAWQQVLGIRAAIAELKGEAAKPVYSGAIRAANLQKLEVKATAVGRTRQELAHELEQRAFSELAYIEARERKKIEQDLAAKKLELEAAMQSAVARKSDEIKLRMASLERDLRSNRSSERLETELRITSIKSRLKLLNASEEQKARRDLADAQELLSVFDSETQKCVDEQCEAAKDELKNFVLRERLSVEKELSQLRAERENQLEQSIREQQEILVAGVHTGTDGQPGGFVDVKITSIPAGVRKTRSLKRSEAAQIDKDAVKAVKRLEQTEKRLVARILRDVTNTAQSVASENGFRVTFEKNRAVRDFTEQIAKVVSGPGTVCVNVGKGGAG